MELEERAYQVHPAQLRWAMSSLSAAGVPIVGYTPAPSGMMIIVVQMPTGAPDLDWQEQQPARRKRRHEFDTGRLVVWALVLIIVAGAGYLAYAAIAGGALPQLAANLRGVLDSSAPPAPAPVATPAPTPATPEPSLLDSIGAWLNGNQPPAQPTPQPQGWLPANPIGDAIDGAKSAADSTVAAIGMMVNAVLVLAALVGLWFMRGIIGPLCQGLGALVKGLFGLFGGH